MYDIDSDINAIQKILANNKPILELMGLTNAQTIDKAKRIIKKSQYDNLDTDEKRICIYSLPARPTRNSDLFEELIQIDVHTPSSLDNKARQIVGKIVDALNNNRINGRYIKCNGNLGELSTASGFYCHGVRFGFYSPF